MSRGDEFATLQQVIFACSLETSETKKGRKPFEAGAPVPASNWRSGSMAIPDHPIAVPDSRCCCILGVVIRTHVDKDAVALITGNSRGAPTPPRTASSRLDHISLEGSTLGASRLNRIEHHGRQLGPAVANHVSCSEDKQGDQGDLNPIQAQSHRVTSLLASVRTNHELSCHDPHHARCGGNTMTTVPHDPAARLSRRRLAETLERRLADSRHPVRRAEVRLVVTVASAAGLHSFTAKISS